MGRVAEKAKSTQLSEVPSLLRMGENIRNDVDPSGHFHGRRHGFLVEGHFHQEGTITFFRSLDASLVDPPLIIDRPKRIRLQDRPMVSTRKSRALGLSADQTCTSAGFMPLTWTFTIPGDGDSHSSCGSGKSCTIQAYFATRVS